MELDEKKIIKKKQEIQRSISRLKSLKNFTAETPSVEEDPQFEDYMQEKLEEDKGYADSGYGEEFDESPRASKTGRTMACSIDMTVLQQSSTNMPAVNRSCITLSPALFSDRPMSTSENDMVE